MKIKKKYINGKYYKIMPYVADVGKESISYVPIFLYSMIEDSNAFKIFTFLAHISEYKIKEYKQICEFEFETIENVLKVNKNIILKSLAYLSKLEIIKVVSIENEKVVCELYRLEECNNDEDEYITTAYEMFGDKILEDEILEDEIFFIEREIKENKSNNKKRDDKGYNTWKRQVLERDNYTCRLCGCTDEETVLNVHHIERYADNKELRVDINNGITLCCNCHKKIFGKEKEYEEYFKKILNK